MWKVLLSTCVMLVALAPLGQVLHADLVGIEYRDRANPSFPDDGGPLWTGVVDTVTNRLRIDTWRELPGHSTDFWTPAQLPITPMVWEARGANGLLFDVPDNFGLNSNNEWAVDFGDDSPQNALKDFAFISPVSLQDMPWYGFDVANGVVDKSKELQFTLSSVIYPGWGGDAFIHPTNGYTVRVVQPSSSSTDEYDYRNIPILPVSPTNIASATNATITVTFRDSTPMPHIYAIPEPAAYLSLALVGAGCGVATWWKKRTLRQ